ncbi:hypothetical protein NXX62_07230 [Bacteroides thetaiotaomicron]|nr:hypothetical protein [Bacteroides thetaiotaomicron]
MAAISATFAFSPIIIGLCAKFRRFISCAAMHIISVLPVPQAKRKAPCRPFGR